MSVCPEHNKDHPETKETAYSEILPALEAPYQQRIRDVVCAAAFLPSFQLYLRVSYNMGAYRLFVFSFWVIFWVICTWYDSEHTFRLAARQLVID